MYQVSACTPISANMTLFSIPVMYHKEATTAISSTSDAYNLSRARRAPIRMKTTVLLTYVRGPINLTSWWVASRVPGQGLYHHTNMSYLPSGQQSELACTWSSSPGFDIQGARERFSNLCPEIGIQGGTAPRRTIFGQNYLQIAASPRSRAGCGVLTANL